VVLVDGNNHQIDRINAEARKRKVEVTIEVDFIHVLCGIPHKTCYADSGIMPRVISGELDDESAVRHNYSLPR
jgi:hypothetical protein